MHPNNLLLEQQSDFIEIEPVANSNRVFRVLQQVSRQPSAPQPYVKRIVKVYRNAHQFYALKLQKSLLMQTDSPLCLYEVRKVAMHYLFIFEDKGKSDLLGRVLNKKSLSNKQAKVFLSQALQQLKWLQESELFHSRIQPSHWVMKKKSATLVGWSHVCEPASGYEIELLPNEDYEGLMYCAPERWNANFSQASEIYSLGLCLYFALTGEHLIEAIWQDVLAKYGGSEKAIELGVTPKTWQIAWLKQTLMLPKLNTLKSSWQNLLRWMLDVDPLKRPTLMQLEQWLNDKHIIQAINLRQPESVLDATDWSQARLMTALADQHLLNAIYENGVQAKQQGKMGYAFNLFENCVFKNHSLSEVALGEMYEVGEPISQSFALAATMYYQAFCKANPYGAYGLAKLLENGLGLPSNQKHAAILYRFAAMRGLLRAQVALGKLYAQDPKQLHMARFWLVLAVQRGASEAQELLYAVLQQLLQDSQAQLDNVSSLSVNLLEEDATPEQVNVVKIPMASTFVNPDKILTIAQGLEAKMEGLIDALPE